MQFVRNYLITVIEIDYHAHIESIFRSHFYVIGIEPQVQHIEVEPVYDICGKIMVLMLLRIFLQKQFTLFKMRTT